MQNVPGLEDVGVFNVLGQSHLAFRVDPEKCQRWGVQVADVNNVAASALGGKALTQMIEGEKLFDVSIRWPDKRRASETSILDIPGRRGQQPGGAAAGAGLRALGERHAPAAARGRRQPGQHGQPA